MGLTGGIPEKLAPPGSLDPFPNRGGRSETIAGGIEGPGPTYFSARRQPSARAADSEQNHRSPLASSI